MAEPTDDPKETPAPEKGARLFSQRSLRSPSEALHPVAPPPEPPPARKKKRRGGTLSALSGFLSLLLIAAIGAAVGVGFAQQKLRSSGPLTEDKILFIAPRTDVPDILAQLEREGIIDAPLLLNITLWLEGNRGNVKAGEYLFKREASLRDVMDLLVSGKQVLHSITIPEGLTSEQIVHRLRETDFLAGDLREMPKEGMLLPETYRVPRGMSRSDLLRKMQDDQRKLLEQIWARRSPDLPLRTPHELVTLASIVEKETGKSDERPRVAGVFFNRLSKRMKLQSDPTIVYGLVGGKGTLGRGITRAEITQASPYNTYVIEGLPPGPIANPGRAALEAVANPAATKDLYFVADGTGGHAFAETLDQHGRNVTRWRQIEKEKADAPVDVDRAPTVLPGDSGTPPVPAPKVAPPRGQRGVLDLPGPGHALVETLPHMADISLSARFGLKGPQASGPAPATVLALRAAEARKLAAAGKRGKVIADFSMGSGIDTLAIRGLTDRPVLDGDEDADEPGVDPTLYPVSPHRLADQKARAARFDSGAGALPATDELPQSALALQPVQHANGPRKIFDASEGTALDPLRDKSWDLNSPKKIPAGLR